VRPGRNARACSCNPLTTGDTPINHAAPSNGARQQLRSTSGRSTPQDADGRGLEDVEGDGRAVTMTTEPGPDIFDRQGRLLAYVTTDSSLRRGAAVSTCAPAH
jgi:hypothetical protein